MDNFSEKEFEKALKKTLEELKMLKIPSKEKKAFLLGGQPGAGKSGMTILLTKEIENENIIVINGDDFRKKHPHFILNFQEDSHLFRWEMNWKKFGY